MSRQSKPCFHSSANLRCLDASERGVDYACEDSGLDFSCKPHMSANPPPRPCMGAQLRGTGYWLCVTFYIHGSALGATLYIPCL